MKKRILTLLAAVCLLSAVLSGCGGGSQNGMTGTTDQSTANTQTEGPAARAAAGELNVGIAQDLDSSLDPHKTVKAGTREVMFNVFEGLLKPDASGNLNPAVAESYTVSEDHLLYTFKLRTGVKFHNGQEVTPEDVIWSYQRCGDANAPADIIQVAAFANVEMYQEGDDTVCFQLQEPNNEFASYLTTAVLPKDYTEQDTAPVGTGPFKFVSRTAQESVVLERFDDYWGEKPDLTKVTYKIIENADSILLSLQSGAVDVFAHLTTTQIQQLGDGFHVEEGTMNLVQALYLNNAEKPFDDVRVRQALCYAIDRQQILDLAFDGYGTLLGSSMYPAFSKYFDDELTNYYTYNTEKAKELRVIWKSPLIPSDPLVWRKDLPEETKKKITDFIFSYGVKGENVEQARKILTALQWGPFIKSDNSQLIPLRQLELFRAKTVLEGNKDMDAKEKAAKIADIERKLAELGK